MGNSNAASRPSSAQSSSKSTSTEPPPPGYYQMIKQGYNDLVHAIIRPPRCTYQEHHLGPRHFSFAGKQFQRIDYELLNPRGLKIVCSLWEPVPECRNNPILPCVIYMHGNSSARVEALTQLSLVLAMGATCVSFDFTGSGKSGGEWVSLGAYEKEDLKCVIEHLRGLGNTSTIALWGRSMGAATALLHGERDPSIAGMILDSAFADLQLLAEEMVEKGRQNGLFAPTFLVSIAIRLIRNTVQKTAGFDIKTLCPIAHADKCFIPALFVAAEGDEFVPPHHSQKIYQKYAGDKNIILVEGDHNSARPRFLFDSASIFLVHVLQIPATWMLDNADAYRKSYGLPPWDNNHGSSRRKPSAQSSSSAAATDNGKGGTTTAPSADETSVSEGLGSGYGMTNEHQATLRSKLYTMLGDRGTAATAAAAKTANANANSNSNSNTTTLKQPPQSSPPSSSSRGIPSSASTSSQLPLPPPVYATATPGPAKSAAKYSSTLDALDDSGKEPPDLDDSRVSNETEDGDGGISAAAASLEPLGIMDMGLMIDDIDLDEYLANTEWTCDQCTLINNGIHQACLACDAPRGYNT